MPNSSTKLILTAGDTLTLPQTVLTDSQGNPVNLASLTVTFRMVNFYTGDIAVNNQPAQVLQNAAQPSTWGEVAYIWNNGETSTPGLYQCWFLTTSTDGRTSHFPPDGDFYLLIQPGP